MGLPAWLQNEGAWIAIGVSALFLLAGMVMHRVFMNILKRPSEERPNETPTHE